MPESAQLLAMRLLDAEGQVAAAWVWQVERRAYGQRREVCQVITEPECHKLEEQHLVSKGPCDVLPPSLLGGAMIIYLLNTLSPRLRTAFQGQGLLSYRPMRE